jgi:methionyl-tRNA synthetase
MPLESVATTAASISAELLASSSSLIQTTFSAGASGIPVSSADASLAALVQDFFLNHPAEALIINLALMVWLMTAKGLGLWHSARLKHTIWFIVMLLTNTWGILELVYIMVLSKVDWAKFGAKFGWKSSADTPSSKAKTTPRD